MNAKYRRVYTLAFVRAGSSLLLGMKKRGFGQGRWNGFGGKLESGETALQAAVRELREESGLLADQTSTKHVGRLEFEFESQPELMQVEVFTVNSENCTGDVQESDEMKPQWFSLDQLPFDKMWPDDKHWFPRMLGGHLFFGTFLFRGHDHIVNFELRDSDDRELANVDKTQNNS